MCKKRQICKLESWEEKASNLKTLEDKGANWSRRVINNTYVKTLAGPQIRTSWHGQSDFAELPDVDRQLDFVEPPDVGS